MPGSRRTSLLKYPRGLRSALTAANNKMGNRRAAVAHRARRVLTPQPAGRAQPAQNPPRCVRANECHQRMHVVLAREQQRDEVLAQGGPVEADLSALWGAKG
jgi:hypothetical protein